MAWVKIETQGRYTIWKKRVGTKFIYNTTTTGRVPTKGATGYYSKEALKQLNGLH
jgi:hypothetical protein